MIFHYVSGINLAESPAVRQSHFLSKRHNPREQEINDVFHRGRWGANRMRKFLSDIRLVSGTPEVCDSFENDGVPTLPSDFIQEVNNHLVLSNPHAVEVFSNRIRKLILPLPPLFLTSCHSRRHSADC
jgi:hypothetical protein